MAEGVWTLLPLHWLRPQALWALLPILLLPLWGRRDSARAVPRGVIAEHLLPHLLLGGGRRTGLRPGDTLALALACFCIAWAGPAWQREPAPFAQEAAPLMLALDLSAAMDAVDLPPRRLDRARDKLRQLLAQRGDAPTGLLVYAGSAHLVLPPTADRQVLLGYLDALSTDLMPTPGQAPAQALALALQWLDRSAVPGTVLFLTADWPAAELARSAALLKGSRQRLLVWALGTPEGGLLRDAQGQLITDAQGRSRSARLDVAGLQALRERSAAALISLSSDGTDLQRIQALIASQSAQAQEQDQTRRWRDSGPWFIGPGLLALLFSLRRGWVLPSPALWLLALLILGGASPSPAWAQAEPGRAPSTVAQRFVSWWLTPDQQGRWWLERGDPARAAQHFADPFWRGLAHARAGHWAQAAQDFARVDSAAAWFNQAQALAHQGLYVEAVAAYDQALLRLPTWGQAQQDRERVRSLIPREPEQAADDGDPQAGEGDREGKSPGKRSARKPGPARRLSEAEINSLWLQRLDTSPAGFLRRKFEIQSREAPPRPQESRP